MTRHLLIASEQLWPNLLGLAALMERDGGVASLHILHTDDERRSAAPARQIARLAATMQPGLPVSLHPTGLTSQEVIATVHSLLNTHGADSAGWSINATGGTKTMFAGLAPWVRRPGVEAFYREVTGIWFQLRPLEVEGLQLLACEEWQNAASARLTLPVASLATVQGDHPPDARWSHAKPFPLDLVAITQAGIAGSWNWRELQQRFPDLGSGHTGFAFESFFGALLLACGAHNTACNLKMEENGVSRQEFDAIVCTGQKLVIFDLKLTESADDAKIDQFSRLSEDRRTLGGLAASAIAVRPSWHRDASLAALARSHQVEVWFQEDMARLPDLLVKTLVLPAITASHSLHPVCEMLQQAAADGKRLFSRSQTLFNTQAPVETRIGWLNLMTYVQECRAIGHRTVVFDLGGRYLVRDADPPAKWRDRQSMRDSLPNGCDLEWYFKSANSGAVMAMLMVKRTELSTQIRDWLRALEPLPP